MPFLIRLFVLAFVSLFMATTASATCTDDPRRCTVSELCKRATIGAPGNKQWVSFAPAHVEAAKSKGLACGVTPDASNALSSGASITANATCPDDPKACSFEELCKRATYGPTNEKKWAVDRWSGKYVTEAKRKGYTCDVVTASVETGDSQTAKSKAGYRIVLFCGYDNTHVGIQACFHRTEIKLTSNEQTGVYKYYNIRRLGNEYGDGFHINVSNSFQIIAQNDHATFTLGINIYDEYNNEVYQDMVGGFGVINVGTWW